MRPALICGALCCITCANKGVNKTMISLSNSGQNLRHLILPFLLLTLSACASKSTDLATCDQSDWYELGRRDGSQGISSDRLERHQKRCDKGFRSDWETMYTNGRNAGLVEYCEAKNGYDLGRMGIAYLYVCPSTVEPQFLTAYRRGQQARDLELESKKLELEIDQVSQKLLIADNQPEQQELAAELTQLKKVRAEKERQLSRIITK